MKRTGDEHAKVGRFREAANAYGAALSSLGNTDLEQRGALLSNRSMCRLKLEDPVGALRDAESAVLTRPQWSKARLRAAAAHLALNHPHATRFYLQEAAELSPALRADATVLAMEKAAVSALRQQEEAMPTDDLLAATNAWAHAHGLNAQTRVMHTPDAGLGLVAGQAMQAGEACACCLTQLICTSCSHRQVTHTAMVADGAGDAAQSCHGMQRPGRSAVPHAAAHHIKNPPSPSTRPCSR